MSKVKNAQAGMLSEDEFLTIEEQDRLLTFWEGQAALARAKGRQGEIKTYLTVSFMLRTGLRASEAINVQVGDVCLKGDTPHVLVRSGKGNKSRKVYIGGDEYFRSWLLVQFCAAGMANADGVTFDDIVMNANSMINRLQMEPLPIGPVADDE